MRHCSHPGDEEKIDDILIVRVLSQKEDLHTILGQLSQRTTSIYFGDGNKC